MVTHQFWELESRFKSDVFYSTYPVRYPGRRTGRNWADLRDKCPITAEGSGVATRLKFTNKNYAERVEDKFCIGCTKEPDAHPRARAGRGI